MTKTVRILSILAAIAVVLLVALPAVFSSQVNDDDREFLDSPGIIDKYKKIKNMQTSQSESPLVTQAKKFALYLNPPKPKSPPKPARNERVPAAPPKPAAPARANFDLEGTSYFPDNPQMSMALISEPGKGLRWVRQSGEVGHLKIKQVLDGKIVIEDGKRTYEMEPKRQTKRSLIKGEGSSVSAGYQRPQQVTTRPTGRRAASPRTRRQARSRSRQRPPTVPNRTVTATQPPNNIHTATPEQMDKLIQGLDGIEDPNEIQKKMEEFISSFSQIDNNEAADLEKLGKELAEENSN